MFKTIEHNWQDMWADFSHYDCTGYALALRFCKKLNLLVFSMIKKFILKLQLHICNVVKILILFWIGIMAFMILIYGVVTILSVYGNALILWVVSTTKSLQNVNNLLIINLAISDMIIAVFCIPFQFYAALGAIHIPWY